MTLVDYKTKFSEHKKKIARGIYDFAGLVHLMSPPTNENHS